MAVTNTPSTLASRLKEVYADGTTSLIPAKAELMKRLKFSHEPGELVRFDVQLSGEGGFSWGVGEVTLNAAIAQVAAKAEVSGKGTYLRSRVSYDLITAAKDSKKAFARFNDSKFVPMHESFRKMEEVSAIDGGQGLGVVATGGVSGQVITLSPRSWNSYRWLGTEGRILEAFTAITGGSQHDGDLTIVSIDVTNKAITVSGTCSSVVATDILFFKGQRGNEPYGLMHIAKNTGTLYNISATTYALWAANVYNVGTSCLTLGKILEAAAMSADKGCDEKLSCFVPVKAFQSLVSDEAALRQYGANYNSKEGKNGFEKLVFAGATGDIEVVPYMPMREGEFVMFPERLTSLIGSQEATNSVAKDGDIIFDVEASTSKEMRMMSNWTVFCERPGFITYGYRSDGLSLEA